MHSERIQMIYLLEKGYFVTFPRGFFMSRRQCHKPKGISFVILVIVEFFSDMSQVSWELFWWHQRKLSLSHHLVWQLVINPQCIRRKSGSWSGRSWTQGQWARGGEEELGHLLRWEPAEGTAAHPTSASGSTRLCLKSRALAHSSLLAPDTTCSLCLRLNTIEQAQTRVLSVWLFPLCTPWWDSHTASRSGADDSHGRQKIPMCKHV